MPMPVMMNVDDQVNASVAYFAGAILVTSKVCAVSAGATQIPARKGAKRGRGRIF